MAVFQHGGNPNFRCAELTISCPGLADETVAVGLAFQPGGTAPVGTIVTHGGATGTRFEAGALPQAWYSDGYNLAEISWGSVWECPLGGTASSCVLDTSDEATRPGLKEAGCRPATAIQWIHDQAQLPDAGPFFTADAGFCGAGGSAGSGAFWFSLLHYGRDAVLDFAQLTASTPFARIDVGCNPAYSGVSIPATCQNLTSEPELPQVFTPGPITLLNETFSVSTCSTTPTADDIAYWARGSVVSTGAHYAQRTPVSTYDCIDLVGGTVNLVPGMNSYLFPALWSADTEHTQYTAQCVLNGTNGTCSGEGVLADAPTAAAATLEMERRCTPLRR